MVIPLPRGCSHCLWWAHYFWNATGNEDWSPSRSNSIRCDWGLYMSRHAKSLALVYTVADSSGKNTPNDITCLQRLFLMNFTCRNWQQECIWMSREIQTDNLHNIHTHSQTHTHLCKGGSCLWCYRWCNKRSFISKLAKCEDWFRGW